MTSGDRRFAVDPSTPSSADWQDVVNQVTSLFQTKKMTMKLQELINKVKNAKSDFGNAIIDRYQESILMKGMIILREEVREKSGEYLDKLATCWTAFFCNILPTLQAVFLSLPQANGLSIREISLVYFRDIVVLKTKLDEVIAAGQEIPPRIIQMLLVLQSVHDQNTENYQKLEKLVSSTVTPYLSTSGLTENMTSQTGNSNCGNEATEQHQVKSYFTGSERLHPVMENDSSSHSQQSSSSSITTVTTIGTSSLSQ